MRMRPYKIIADLEAEIHSLNVLVRNLKDKVDSLQGKLKAKNGKIDDNPAGRQRIPRQERG